MIITEEHKNHIFELYNNEFNNNINLYCLDDDSAKTILDNVVQKINKFIKIPKLCEVSPVYSKHQINIYYNGDFKFMKYFSKNTCGNCIIFEFNEIIKDYNENRGITNDAEILLINEFIKHKKESTNKYFEELEKYINEIQNNIFKNNDSSIYNTIIAPLLNNINVKIKNIKMQNKLTNMLK